MPGSWGNYVKITIFGESHGPAVGVTVDGLPAGFAPDMDAVRAHMARRAPGNSPLSTPRKEADEFEVLSGLYQGKLTGTPLTAIIRNLGQRSADYSGMPDLLRPGHADYTGHVRYLGHEDPRGGGHFSGRITAALTFAGALALQWLSSQGVEIAAKIIGIGPLSGDGLTEEMQDAILAAKADGDSIGGRIECRAAGLPAGLGAPFFDSVESVMAHMLFSIPAVKGVEFGDGFAISALRGSVSNDQMVTENGIIRHLTNHAGGILGGITNGEPLIVRVAIKPPASIARSQHTVSLKRGVDAVLAVEGRHDPCIAPRALPVVESAVALALSELWKERLTWTN